MSPASPAPHPYRILMVAPTSFFSDYGCHVRILEEARILHKLGHAVTVVTYYKGRDLPDLETVRTRPVPWREEYEVGSSRHKIGFDVLLSWTALRLIVRRRFDLIHAHLHEGALIGWFLASLRRIPLVFDFQGSMTAEMADHKFLDPTGRWYGGMRGLETRINRLSQAILTSSQHSAQFLAREFKVDPERIHAVPDAVDLDFFDPDCLSPDQRTELKLSLGIPPRRPVVVYLGLLTDYQGTDRLLQAAADLRRRQVDAHFLIMGYPSVGHYQHMAEDLGLSGWVTFTGKIPYERAPTYLALGDVAVAPKISDSEGSGKILNYMAMELPTVAFDMPVSREFLGDHGAFAEPGNAHSLADEILNLLTSPERSSTLGRQSRQRVARFYSWDQAGRQIVGIYDGLVQPDQAPVVADQPAPTSLSTHDERQESRRQ